MMKPKILLFTSLYPNPWSPNKATFNLQQYSELAKTYDVEFLVPIPWLEWVRNIKLLITRQEYKNVSYFPFFNIPGLFKRFNSFILIISIFACIYPAIKLFKAKYVIASWAFPDGVACAALKKIFRYKLVIQCLGSDVNFHSQQAFKRWLLSRSFKAADNIVTVSKALEHEVKKISPFAKTTTIYNGVNFNLFSVKTETKFEKNITFIGSLIKTKGVYELLGAAKKIIHLDNTFNFNYIGEGPERKELERLAERDGIANNVTFHGSLKHGEIVTFLKATDLLVLPSYREGVPNVIMESIACGTPVVATKVGGIPEIINNENGVLIDSYSPEDIIQGIEACYQVEWCPKNIRKSINNYTWEMNVTQLSTVIFEK